ncbi:MAG TPA: MarR family transcriptional regulator [Polyangiaceae bacterium]|jgi:DNA-binding MarR family transcriptional regulator|nr:MarR family transcriptional regulator [Polyangiaceae bacterium]
MRSLAKDSSEVSKNELGEVLGFMRLLWAVAHRLQSVSKRMQTRMGVTGPQRLVIRIIGHYERVSPGQLARVLQLDPSSLTGVLKRLERAGFVARAHDPTDARRAVLQLTRDGRRMDANRAGTVEAAIGSALGSLPTGMVRASEDVLRQIATELELRWGAEDDDHSGRKTERGGRGSASKTRGSRKG